MSHDDRVETQHDELVFGERSIEQTRGMIERARVEPEVDAYPVRPAVSARNYYFSAAMLNRSVGQLIAQKWKIEEDGTCGAAPVPGSSFLVSDTRLVTAWHVYAGTASEYTPVFFEVTSEELDTGWYFPSEKYVADDRDATRSYRDDDTRERYDDTREHGWGTGREETSDTKPFLPNRLFILGLEDWAAHLREPSMQARRALQTEWRFVPDEFEMGQPGYDASTIFNQGFLSRTSDEIVGRDLMILKARALQKRDFPEEAAPDRLPSGEFPLRRPAVFFGKVVPAGLDRLERADLSDEENRMHFVNSAMRWPTNEHEGQRAMLTSLNGTRFHEVEDKPTIAGFVEGCEQPRDFQLQHVFGSSHDLIKGSSGGAYLMPDKKEGPGIAEHSMWSLRAVGAVQGGRLDEVEERHADGWHEPFSRPTPRLYSQFTKFLEDDLPRLDRDPSGGSSSDEGDPSSPTPHLSSFNPSCLEWSGTPGSGYCTQWEGETVVTPPGSPPLTVDVVDEDELQTPATGRRAGVSCHNASFQGPGVAVGIHGGIAFGAREDEEPNRADQPPSRIVEDGGGVGSFYFVCAPYSGISYTENWRFLKVKGGSIPRSADTVSGPYRWGHFDDFFSRVYEQRYHPDIEENIMVRPASAKMCRPNYLLNGLTYARAADGRFLGVESLRCVSPESNPGKGGRDVMTVYLKDSDAAQARGWDPDGSDFRYELRGKDFSLSQYVGYPECSSSSCQTLKCDDGVRGPEVAVGFATRHDNDGVLTDLNLRCLEAP